MTCFRLEVPLAGFRPDEARDFQETFPLPPHSTVFGCLCSIIGVDSDGVAPYLGTHVGVAGTSRGRSTVLRKMRRDPANQKPDRAGWPEFRPDYQELLSDLTVWARVERGDASRDLAQELVQALQNPGTIDRHGVVSLGESAFMLDSITVEDEPPDAVRVLRPRLDGLLSLTTWVDFANRDRRRRMRFESVVGRLDSSDCVAVGP